MHTFGMSFVPLRLLFLAWRARIKTCDLVLVDGTGTESLLVAAEPLSVAPLGPFVFVVVRVGGLARLWPWGKEFLVWGFYPTVLLHHHNAVVQRRWCLDKPLLPAHVPYYTHLATPTIPVTLEEAKELVNERIAHYRALDKSQRYRRALFPRTTLEREVDLWAYQLTLAAACCVVDDCVGPFERRAFAEFIQGEQAIALHRLAWCGSSPCMKLLLLNDLLLPKSMGEPLAKLVQDEGGTDWVSVDAFSHGVPLLPPHRGDQGQRLENGKLLWALWRWTPYVLKRLEAVRQQHVHMARGAQRRGAGIYDERGMREILSEPYKVLQSMRDARVPAKHKICGSNVGTVVMPMNDIHRLVEVMPLCMKRLHDRAIGTLTPHLEHDDRLVYLRFMIGNRVNPDDLIQFQGDAHIGRMTQHEYSKYMKTTVKSGVDSTIKWLEKKGADFIGDSCKSLCAKGYCAFPADTPNRSMAHCQLHRANLLKRADKDNKPAGTALLYAQRLRKELDAKRTVSEAAL